MFLSWAGLWRLFSGIVICALAYAFTHRLLTRNEKILLVVLVIAYVVYSVVFFSFL